MMHRFDAADLTRQLDALPIEARVAFALACAERLASYSSRPDDSQTRELAQAARELARQSLAGASIAPEALGTLAARLESLPDIDDDDVAACAYVLECLRTGAAQAAVAAAERAYGARERVVEKGLLFSVYTPEIEAALLADPRIQAELAYQRADLESLGREPRSHLLVVDRARGSQSEPGQRAGAGGDR